MNTKKELIKYIVGGISNTIFSYFMYCILALFLNYKISYLLSIFFSILYSYKINTKLVFNIDRKNIAENNKFNLLFFVIVRKNKDRNKGRNLDK